MNRFFMVESDMFRWIALILFSCMCQFGVANDCRQLTLVKLKTADNIISNHIAKTLLEKNGYSVDTFSATSSVEAYDALSESEADVYLSTWIPIDTENLKQYALRGEVKTLKPVLSVAVSGLATNQFGTAAGLTSFEQIANFGDVLDYTIYVGQDDWLFAQRMQTVIDSNIYGLSAFKIRRVHNFDFNEYLSLAEQQQRPMVFFSRQPSFLNGRYKAKFLVDRDHFFDEYQTKETVYSSVRYNLRETCPNTVKFFERFSFKATDYQTILNAANYQPAELISATDRFLSNNEQLVNEWLKAIPSPD